MSALPPKVNLEAIGLCPLVDRLEFMSARNECLSDSECPEWVKAILIDNVEGDAHARILASRWDRAVKEVGWEQDHQTLARLNESDRGRWLGTVKVQGSAELDPFGGLVRRCADGLRDLGVIHATQPPGFVNVWDLVPGPFQNDQPHA